LIDTSNLDSNIYYVNKTISGFTDSTGTDNTVSGYQTSVTYFGYDLWYSSYGSGYLDEVRYIDDRHLSSNWIATEYDMMSKNNYFASSSGVETLLEPALDERYFLSFSGVLSQLITLSIIIAYMLI
jgi:hypothetical protein